MQGITERSSIGLPAAQLPPQVMGAFIAFGSIFAVLFAGTLLILLWRVRGAFEAPEDQAAA